MYGGRTDPERHPGRLAREQAAARRAEQAARAQAQRRPCVLSPDVLAAIHASASEAAVESRAAYVATLSPETLAHLRRVNAARRAAATTEAPSATEETGSSTHLRPKERLAPIEEQHHD